MTSIIHQIPADVWRIIFQYIPHCRRAFRVVSKRAWSLFPSTDLWSLSDDIELCCQSGHLEVLKLYPIEIVVAQTAFAFRFPNAAAKGGHLDVLKWLRQQGCPFGRFTTEEAVKYGHFELLKWAIDDGAYCHSDAFYAITYRGDLDILEYIVDHPKVGVCVTAAFRGAVSGGKLECLIWLRKKFPNEDPGPYWTRLAVEYGQLKVLKWLHGQNFELNKQVCLSQARQNPEPDPEMIEWLISQPD